MKNRKIEGIDKEGMEELRKIGRGEEGRRKRKRRRKN